MLSESDLKELEIHFNNVESKKAILYMLYGILLTISGFVIYNIIY